MTSADVYWRLRLCAIAFLLGGCVGPASSPNLEPASIPATDRLFDSARQREIPVALYGATPGYSKPLAVISHGYRMRNTDYSFIATALVIRGFVVASRRQTI